MILRSPSNHWDLFQVRSREFQMQLQSHMARINFTMTLLISVDPKGLLLLIQDIQPGTAGRTGAAAHCLRSLQWLGNLSLPQVSYRYSEQLSLKHRFQQRIERFLLNCGLKGHALNWNSSGHHAMCSLMLCAGSEAYSILTRLGGWRDLTWSQDPTVTRGGKLKGEKGYSRWPVHKICACQYFKWATTGNHYSPSVSPHESFQDSKASRTATN